MGCTLLIVTAISSTGKGKDCPHCSDFMAKVYPTLRSELLARGLVDDVLQLNQEETNAPPHKNFPSAIAEALEYFWFPLIVLLPTSDFMAHKTERRVRFAIYNGHRVGAKYEARSPSMDVGKMAEWTAAAAVQWPTETTASTAADAGVRKYNPPPNSLANRGDRTKHDVTCQQTYRLTGRIGGF